MKRTGAGTEGETGVGSGCGQRPVVSLERVEEVRGGGVRGEESAAGKSSGSHRRLLAKILTEAQIRRQRGGYGCCCNPVKG